MIAWKEIIITTLVLIALFFYFDIHSKGTMHALMNHAIAFSIAFLVSNLIYHI